MPQSISKFERPLTRPVSTPACKTQKKRQTWCRWRKKSRKDTPGVSSPEPPQHEEDWEKEIQEFSLSMENERRAKEQTPYDPEDELNVAMDEMTLYSVPKAPSLDQDQYTPSTHHVPPVKWIRVIYSRVSEQFTDAEE